VLREPLEWLIDRLEERGLVERRPLPTDRRVKTIALTPKGVKFRRRMLFEMFTPPEELLGLDASTLEALRSELEKLPAPVGTSWFAPAGRPARKT
jgi:MarR family transcriptional regulator, organic hydroperoxide resistance regulator